MNVYYDMYMKDFLKAKVLRSLVGIDLDNFDQFSNNMNKLQLDTFYIFSKHAQIIKLQRESLKPIAFFAIRAIKDENGKLQMDISTYHLEDLDETTCYCNSKDLFNFGCQCGAKI